MEPNQVPVAGQNQVPQKSSSVWKIVIIVILVIIGLGIAAMVALGFFVKSLVTGGGLENFVENQIEKETGKEADIDFDREGGSMSINAGGGSFEVSADGSVKVPVAISTVAPIMPGATAKSAVSVDQTADQRAGSWVFFASTASAADIKAYYEKEMVGRGWTKEADFSQSGASMISFKKGDQILAVNISPLASNDANEAGFQLVLTGKQ